MSFYYGLVYAFKEEQEVGTYTISSYTVTAESTNPSSARDAMVNFAIEKYPYADGYTGHAISVADTTGFRIEREPGVGQFDPGYHVFFAYAAREYYRSPYGHWRPPEVRVVSSVTYCHGSTDDGLAAIAKLVLEKFPTDGFWRGHIQFMVNTAGFRIIKEGE